MLLPLLRTLLLTFVVCFGSAGCAVVAVTGAAVTVASTAVKAGTAVVSAVVDVGAAGVRVATGNDE